MSALQQRNRVRFLLLRPLSGRYGAASGGYTDLARALRKYKAGDETTLRIYRGGKEIVLQIVLDEKPREDSGNTSETTPVEPTGQMPQTGNFFEWYQYLEPFFKGKED